MAQLTKQQKLRIRAVFLLLSSCEHWGDKYTSYDFLLDNLLRQLLNLSQKKLGSPPYEDWVKL